MTARMHGRGRVQSSDARPAGARGGSAFTLVELLVATAVCLLMLTMLMSVFSGTLQSWTTTAARSETFTEARAALYLLEAELQQIIQKPEQAGAEPRPFIKADLESPLGGEDEALAFVCRVRQDGQPTASAGSDVCAVSYFLAPESDAAAAPHALFRRLAPSEETFAKLSGSVEDLFTGSCVVDGLAEVVAQNVIHFQVQLRDSQMRLLPLSDTGSGLEDPAAAYVEATLKVISTRAAQSYFDPATSAAQKEKIALQDAREFTLRRALR